MTNVIADYVVSIELDLDPSDIPEFLMDAKEQPAALIAANMGKPQATVSLIRTGILVPTVEVDIGGETTTALDLGSSTEAATEEEIGRAAEQAAAEVATSGDQPAQPAA